MKFFFFFLFVVQEKGAAEFQFNMFMCIQDLFPSKSWSKSFDRCFLIQTRIDELCGKLCTQKKNRIFPRLQFMAFVLKLY